MAPPKSKKNSFGFTRLNPGQGGLRLSRNLTGFTLIELLASIFIIALVSGIFMVNYHNTNKRSELKVAAQKLVSDIRLAQNYSLGSKTYDGATTPRGGWGVHFDKLNKPNQYIIFADIDSDKFYTSSPADEAIETKILPAGVTISSLSPGNTVDIVFFPPDPINYINGLAYNTAWIVLSENINNSTATVTVNYFGLIDAE